MAEERNTKRRRKYDASFKSDVLQMAACGRPIPEIARSLGISKTLIYRWRIRSQSDSDHSVGSKVIDDQTAETIRLRAQLHRAEQERDILKKALDIVSRGRKGTSTIYDSRNKSSKKAPQGL